ncbi:43608_t:CDS:2, partial [Gigaspora margarita]
PPIAGSTGSHQSISYHSVEQRRSNSAQNSIDSNSPIHLDDIENRDSSFDVPATKPKTIILDENGNPVSVGSIMVKQSGEKRYCQKCQHDKPDRTHHCFAVYHTSLLFSNQTTLESLTKHNYKIKDDGDVTTSKYLNLFDIGKRANFIQVMGPEWYFWFIPIGNSLGDGRSWPLNSYKYSTLCESVENLTKPPQSA